MRRLQATVFVPAAWLIPMLSASVSCADQPGARVRIEMNCARPVVRLPRPGAPTGASSGLIPCLRRAQVDAAQLAARRTGRDYHGRDRCVGASSSQRVMNAACGTAVLGLPASICSSIGPRDWSRYAATPAGPMRPLAYEPKSPCALTNVVAVNAHVDHPHQGNGGGPEGQRMRLKFQLI